MRQHDIESVAIIRRFIVRALSVGKAERLFVADVASWINCILEGRKDPPFTYSRVEEYPQGKRTRRDLSIYDKGWSQRLVTAVTSYPSLASIRWAV
jgi:hypothetical protein